MKAHAVLLFLAFAVPSPAAVVYSGMLNISIPATLSGVTLDLDDGAIVVENAPGWDINLFFGGFGIAGSAAFQPARTGTGNEDAVLRFEAGALIDGSLPYSSGETGSATHLGAAGNFQDGQPGYLGFRFVTNDNSGPLHGWMRVTLTANTTTGVVHDWAWESGGGGIVAGVVPEPSTVPFALGGAMLILFRRWRAA